MFDGATEYESSLEQQLLTTSDPAVRANMTRYADALLMMLTGGRHTADDLKILTGANFFVSDASEDLYCRLTRTDGKDRMLLRFDIDDALGPPNGLGLFHKEGYGATLYGQCRPWLPPAPGRPIIIFLHEGQGGHFAYRQGEPLRRIDHLPPNDLMPGFLRADARLIKTMRSPKLNMARPVFMNIFRHE
jgi:hypothetical protein